MGEGHEASPFRHVQGDEKKFLPSGSNTENEVSELESVEGERYIRKALIQNQPIELGGEQYFADAKYIAKSLEDLAVQRKDFYSILKKYLGDYLADTNYVIAADKNSKKQINIIQPKIEGVTIKDLVENSEVGSYKELKVDPEVMRQLDEINSIFVDKIQHDPEVKARFSSPLTYQDKQGRKYILTDESPLEYAYQEVLPQSLSLRYVHGEWSNVMVDKNGRVRIIDW